MVTYAIWVLYGISIDASYRNEVRKVPLNQTQIDDFNLRVSTLFDQIPARQTGKIILEGIIDTGWGVAVVPYTGSACNSVTDGRAKMVKGNGFNVVVQFKLDASCFVDPKTRDFKPGGTPAESLFHELVHAFRLVTGKATDRKGPLNPYVPNSLKNYPDYDVVEDFFAILVTNIFASETGRPLRANHDDTTLMPPQLSTSKGFLDVPEYLELVKDFCYDHKSVAEKIRDVPSQFNPIRELLIGQGYQPFLNLNTAGDD
jgi:hypothetical protein